MTSTTITTLTTSASAHTTNPRPRPPLIRTASVIISSPTLKGVATVALSPTSVASMETTLALADKTLRHMRTLRPSDFDNPPSKDDTAPAPDTRPFSTVSSPKAQLHTLQPIRDAPAVPARRKLSDRATSKLSSTSGRGSLGASATAPISRLKRQKTLMPADFKTIQQDGEVADQGFVLFPPDIPRSGSAPPTVNPTSQVTPSRSQQGYIRIVLGAAAEDVVVDNRKLVSSMRHYTVWEREIRSACFVRTRYVSS
ncbi:hypothetical protein EXIGLDRAFT_135608 [Exidia glandulosa HHB12029]|uniref:Uncharacterized protein n=1 Tax=Exidia glandulosa HHB12029 TaxID=1314781 RepID=A0A165NGE6_EXIGL|nr:hypothetical protein EXIGLDRAFT_135608 [Exidia glandulosa HHB12029]